MCTTTLLWSFCQGTVDLKYMITLLYTLIICLLVLLTFNSTHPFLCLSYFIMTQFPIHTNGPFRCHYYRPITSRLELSIKGPTSFYTNSRNLVSSRTIQNPYQAKPVVTVSFPPTKPLRPSVIPP